MIEQVKTNDLQDRRLIIKNSEGVQIFALVRSPKNQMNQTFEATLFNMAGEVSENKTIETIELI